MSLQAKGTTLAIELVAESGTYTTITGIISLTPVGVVINTYEQSHLVDGIIRKYPTTTGADQISGTLDYDPDNASQTSFYSTLGVKCNYRHLLTDGTHIDCPGILTNWKWVGGDAGQPLNVDFTIDPDGEVEVA